MEAGAAHFTIEQLSEVLHSIQEGFCIPIYHRMLVRGGHDDRETAVSLGIIRSLMSSIAAIAYVPPCASIAPPHVVLSHAPREELVIPRRVTEITTPRGYGVRQPGLPLKDKKTVGVGFVAAMFGISEQTVYRLKDRMPCRVPVPGSRAVRFDAEGLQLYRERNGTTLPEGIL